MRRMRYDKDPVKEVIEFFQGVFAIIAIIFIIWCIIDPPATYMGIK